MPDEHRVLLEDGTELGYDQLVIATGTTPRPDQTPGMLGDEWRRSIFDFYTLEGATALRDRLATFEGGRLVVHITEMPIKCPVAPMEFTFLADAFFRERGMRDRVELIYVTPLDGAFTKPTCSTYLGGMLDERKIALETDFMIESIDEEHKALVSYDEREIPFDLLVTVPLNMGADFVGRSGLGDELNFVKVDKHTLQSTQYDDVFAIGDASDIPASKAGSVAHFAVDVFTDNFLDHIHGRPMTRAFDGHANCFIESGDGKALLIDFNYDTEPLPGQVPAAGHRSLQPAEGDRAQPLGEAAVPVDLLERAAARTRAAAAGADVDGRQGHPGGGRHEHHDRTHRRRRRPPRPHGCPARRADRRAAPAAHPEGRADRAARRGLAPVGTGDGQPDRAAAGGRGARLPRLRAQQPRRRRPDHDHFDEDDVAALGDNVVLILETVKEMTQPEVMTMLQRTAHVVNEPGTAPTEPPSLFALLREMREPEVRLGLARLLDVLRSLAAQAPPPRPPPASPTPKEG